MEKWENTGYWRIYRKGARDILLALQPYLPKKQQIPVGKKISHIKATNFFHATLIEQCITDPELLECVLRGGEYQAVYGKGEKYMTLKFVPKRSNGDEVQE